MHKDLPKFFHLHLVSDATGETLTAISKAATVQYSRVRAITHVHPLVRNKRQLGRVIQEIETAPGIVLYTIVNQELGAALEAQCQTLNMPCIAVLAPIFKAFEAYLGAQSTPIVAGQHVLDADYFRRIEAMNFTLMHDDGQLPGDLNDADIVLVGASRTSKTPTSIYLANRGYKTANVSLVPGIPVPVQIDKVDKALVVGLIASAERIAEVRRNRILAFNSKSLQDYTDMNFIINEIAYTRRLCAKRSWPVIDVTRRSIEETAAEIIKLYCDRRAKA
jgi:regulator of PEP synthase PpsR (kinase-PPPase family)